MPSILSSPARIIPARQKTAAIDVSLRVHGPTLALSLRYNGVLTLSIALRSVSTDSALHTMLRPWNPDISRHQLTTGGSVRYPNNPMTMKTIRVACCVGILAGLLSLGFLGCEVQPANSNVTVDPSSATLHHG